MLELIAAHPFRSAVLILSGMIALKLFLNLWIEPQHRETPVAKRLAWSFLVWVPFFGPLAFAGLYRVPGKHNISCCSMPRREPENERP